MTASPNRLRLDGAALADNWRTLAAMSGLAACGAAIKADGYGLGAAGVVRRLAKAGCRDFFVSTWREAETLAELGVTVSVLHGVRDEDMTEAGTGYARPVLNTAAQVARWRIMGSLPCDVMVDTGMNRLGVSVAEVRGGLLDGLEIETLMSHLACADEDSAMNGRQRQAFAELAGVTAARRMSLANSGGIGLGADYAFDLTRPGIALYGGIPRGEFAGKIALVATPQAQILQRRRVRAGESIGYGASWVAPADTEVAILNIGYADGYWRGFSSGGAAHAAGVELPLLGRVSMDLIAVDIGLAAEMREGDWIDIAYDLPVASERSGMSQ